MASIDFGTHGTGGGWVPVSPDNDDPARRGIATFMQWPAQAVPYPKTLTAVLLDRDGAIIAWGEEARRRWSEHQAGDRDLGYRYLRSFKMSLGETTDSGGSPFLRPAIALDDSIRQVGHIIAMYLRKVYRYMLEEITKSGHLAEEIRWCVTVPAIWSDYQKHLMRQAAREAGIPTDDDHFLLALEPEAAAYHARVSGVKTLGDTSADGHSLMRPGARFMVADCGGGTVDITAYQNDEQARMVEIGRVSGDKRGSQYVNEAFVECVLIKRFGGIETLKKLQRSCPIDLEDLLDRWERVKLHARVDQTDPLYLPLNAKLVRVLGPTKIRRLKEMQDNVGDQIVVSPEEVRDIFEQVVPRIITLVDEQLEEMRHKKGKVDEKELVLLVGGFAASPYLQQRLHDHLAGRAEVLIPPNPAVAVLKGAVHFAYDPQTRARRSRLTYGVDVAEPFEHGVDPEDSKYVSSDGTPYCGKRFSVFVQAGQTITTGDEVIHEYVPIEGGETSTSIEFFATEEQDPRYIDSPGCHKLWELEVDLKSVMHLGLEQRNIRVAMLFGETEIKTKVTVAETGKTIDHRLVFSAS